jgi:hypothetical protein
MLSRLTNKLENTLYVFSRKLTTPANYLPLYQSAIFKSTFSITQPKTSMMSSRRVSLPCATSCSCQPSLPP